MYADYNSGLTETFPCILDIKGAVYIHMERSRYVAAEADVVNIMTIADANKSLILQHSTVIHDLVSGLLLEESNPRRGQEQSDKLQEACAATLQTLALSDVGKRTLCSRHDVLQALHRLLDGGLTESCQRYASGALFELDEKFRQSTKATVEVARRWLCTSKISRDIGAGRHVMLSYNWDHQDVIKRINTALQARGYGVWIDIEKMKGSTVEAMAAAVEGAAVFCYGISQAYKESSNCRLEAQYAHQQKKDLVPLMVEEGYSPHGWLGLLLGLRQCYEFYGAALSSESAFEDEMEELCRELGGRAKLTTTAQIDDKILASGARRGHVALSCATEHIAVVRRLSVALKSQGYFTSLALAEARSDIDEATMASEIEGAAVFVYGVSQADKDSVNCQKNGTVLPTTRHTHGAPHVAARVSRGRLAGTFAWYHVVAWVFWSDVGGRSEV